MLEEKLEDLEIQKRPQMAHYLYEGGVMQTEKPKDNYDDWIRENEENRSYR